MWFSNHLAMPKRAEMIIHRALANIWTFLSISKASLMVVISTPICWRSQEWWNETRESETFILSISSCQDAQKRQGSNLSLICSNPPNGSMGRHRSWKITHWAHVGAWPTYLRLIRGYLFVGPNPESQTICQRCDIFYHHVHPLSH